MKNNINDALFMAEALRLAETKAGRTSPDPMVGAVVVKNGKIISKGYHAELGTPHAESYAIRKAGKKAKGSTLYVNLEPCCHYGNNPPCVNLIIKSGIKRVVAAMKDPNPLVAGKGFKKLRSSGIKVDVGIFENQAKKLNEAFIKFITKRIPFVILKSAMSIDGKIATVTGESKWITQPHSRQIVHDLRNKVDALMVGIGTVLADNPGLDVRFVKGKKRNPFKIVMDSMARIPLYSKILKNEPEKAIIVVSKKAKKAKISKIKKVGARVLVCGLKSLMKELAKDGISSIMIEGGGELASGALNAGIVDKILFFVAPKIIGGRMSLTPVEGPGIKSMDKAIKLGKLTCNKIGQDVLIEGYLV